MTFLAARDGLPICFAGSVPLHSAYNPKREAEKFVLSLSPAFVPRFIVITEPAVSYTAQFLRQRFPFAKLIAIRYCTDFRKWDTLWDGTFYVDAEPMQEEAESSLKLKTALFNALGEEGVLSAFFCSWRPSSCAFPSEDAAAWRGIRDAAALSRDILATRTKFASRWVLNAFSLCMKMRRAAGLRKGTAPVVVAASGESLATALPYLKKWEGKYFLIALSSALLPLRHAGIKCNLCITTDGGFYAGNHLLPYYRDKIPFTPQFARRSAPCAPHAPCHAASFLSDAPLAVAAEGYCPAAVLERAAIIPLVYTDGPASDALKRCAPSACMTAERNGTVSGTALRLALGITTGNVYFCGLDMAGGAGRQHCAPNALEMQEATYDTRLRTVEGRTAASRFASSALEIYRNWFSALDAVEVSRVYRLSDGYRYENTLGHIKDVGFGHFSKCIAKDCPPALQAASGGNPLQANDEDSPLPYLPCVVPRPLPSIAERRRIAAAIVLEKGGTQEWLHEIFPADLIACGRSKDEEECERRKALLQEKNTRLLNKINRILNSTQADESKGIEAECTFSGTKDAADDL